MNMKKKSKYLTSLVLTSFAVLILSMPETSQATIINIDATQSGYAYPTDPAPVVGSVHTPIGVLNQLTLAAGTYNIQNASGLAGANANFTGWRYNSYPNWVWNFAIIDDTTQKVLYYADRGGVQTSQSAIASDPSVKSFSDSFTLASNTKLDFVIRDYYLPDNAGGVTLRITPVPEPQTYGMMIAGIGLIGFMVHRKNSV